MAYYAGNGLFQLLCCCLLYDTFLSRRTRAPQQPRVVYVQTPTRPTVVTPMTPVMYGAPVEGVLPLIACATMERESNAAMSRDSEKV